jgi:hypothetical protein
VCPKLSEAQRYAAQKLPHINLADLAKIESIWQVNTFLLGSIDFNSALKVKESYQFALLKVMSVDQASSVTTEYPRAAMQINPSICPRKLVQFYNDFQIQALTDCNDVDLAIATDTGEELILLQCFEPTPYRSPAPIVSCSATPAPSPSCIALPSSVPASGDSSGSSTLDDIGSLSVYGRLAYNSGMSFEYATQITTSAQYQAFIFQDSCGRVVSESQAVNFTEINLYALLRGASPEDALRVENYFQAQALILGADIELALLVTNAAQIYALEQNLEFSCSGSKLFSDEHLLIITRESQVDSFLWGLPFEQSLLITEAMQYQALIRGADINLAQNFTSAFQLRGLDSKFCPEQALLMASQYSFLAGRKCHFIAQIPFVDTKSEWDEYASAQCPDIYGFGLV